MAVDTVDNKIVSVDDSPKLLASPPVTPPPVLKPFHQEFNKAAAEVEHETAKTANAPN